MNNPFTVDAGLNVSPRKTSPAEPEARCMTNMCMHRPDEDGYCTYCNSCRAVRAAHTDPEVQGAFAARLPRDEAERLAQELADKHQTPFSGQRCTTIDKSGPISRDVFAGYRVAPTFDHSLAQVNFTLSPQNTTNN